MKKITIGCLAVAGLIISLCAMSGCKGNADPRSKEVYKIHHFDNNPYLAEVWWGEDYDQDVAIKHMCDKYNRPAEGGGCSSWRKDGFHGRNIDWMMRDYVTLIIHMPRTAKVKYASVSLIAGVPAVNKDFIDSNVEIPAESRSWLPAGAVDGINECGVTINHNIVPYDGKPYEADGDLASPMVVRYVLDNAATAKEAVELLKSRKVTQAVVAIAGDYSHFFISDPTESFVVEWFDGEFHATEFTGDGQGNFKSPNGQPAVMTNYFVAQAEKYGLKTNDFLKNHPTALGIERAETIMAQLPAAATVENHLNICKSVWYSLFCQGKTLWYSENSANYGYCPEKDKAYWFYPEKTDIHWMDNDDIYSAAKALMEAGSLEGYFNEFNTKWRKVSPDNTYWFTEHSVVYDINARKGYVIAQEGMFSDEVVEINIR